VPHCMGRLATLLTIIILPLKSYLGHKHSSLLLPKCQRRLIKFHNVDPSSVLAKFVRKRPKSSLQKFDLESHRSAATFEEKKSFISEKSEKRGSSGHFHLETASNGKSDRLQFLMVRPELLDSIWQCKEKWSTSIKSACQKVILPKVNQNTK
jgi:hypothetical protein